MNLILPTYFPTVVTPVTRCKLKLLKYERINDYLLMETEFIKNQERLKPQEERQEEERGKVDDLRGTPMAVGTLEEIIDDQHAIVSTVNKGKIFHMRITRENY
jgi:26S proteasome regulatory subunit T2